MLAADGRMASVSINQISHEIDYSNQLYQTIAPTNLNLSTRGFTARDLEPLRTQATLLEW